MLVSNLDAISSLAGWPVAASAGIANALGVLHLYFTYFGNKLQPRDAALLDRMDRL